MVDAQDRDWPFVWSRIALVFGDIGLAEGFEGADGCHEELPHRRAKAPTGNFDGPDIHTFGVTFEKK